MSLARTLANALASGIAKQLDNTGDAEEVDHIRTLLSTHLDPALAESDRLYEEYVQTLRKSTTKKKSGHRVPKGKS
jgi:hypothetical protein